MGFKSGYRRLPLVPPHLQDVAYAIRNVVDVIPTDEFWHVPKFAITGNSDSAGTYEWLLVQHHAKGRNQAHIPLIALDYHADADCEILAEEDTVHGFIALRIGPHDSSSKIADYVKYLKTKVNLRGKSVDSLETASFQSRLQNGFSSYGLVALQEVALSDIGVLNEKIRLGIEADLGRGRISIKDLPGNLRFDLVVATPPPMCFALAAIEIDGREHSGKPFNDELKDSYCRSVGLPLIRIAIGSGRGLTKKHNDIHDEYLKYYAKWLAEAVTPIDGEMEHINLLLETIRSIAYKSEKPTSTDLLALVKHTSKSFGKLNGVIAKGLEDVWVEKQQSSPSCWGGDDQLTKTTLALRKDQKDIYLIVECEWREPEIFRYHPHALPGQQELGPFRLSIVADKAFKNSFSDAIELSFDSTYNEFNEEFAQRNLALDALDYIGKTHLLKKRYKLYADLRSSGGDDIAALEEIFTQFLGEPPGCEWNTVDECYLGLSEERRANMTRFYSFGDFVYGPKEICMEYWSKQRKRAELDMKIAESVLSDSTIEISVSTLSLLSLLIDERRSVWDGLDSWYEDNSNVVDITEKALRK